MGIVFAFLGISMVLAGVLLGGTLAAFIDLPSVAIVFGCTTFFTFAYHSVGDTIRAFSVALSSKDISAAEAQQHVRTLSTVRILASASGVVGALIGMVNMLANMDDPRAIGPAMAVALLTVLYGVIIAELFVGPLINRLRNRAKPNDQNENPMRVTVVTLAAVPLPILAFFVMLLSMHQ